MIDKSIVEDYKLEIDDSSNAVLLTLNTLNGGEHRFLIPPKIFEQMNDEGVAIIPQYAIFELDDETVGD
jgi:hypothetical protein